MDDVCSYPIVKCYIFQAHLEEVKRTVLPERLLAYEVKERWRPLCQFVEGDIPATPFPHVNDSETFQRNIRKRLRKGVVKVS